MPAIKCRSDWRLDEVEGLFALPFMDLLHRAHTVHRAAFDPNEIQFSSLLSIKTGGCPEDCAYCPQSAHYDTGVAKEGLMDLDRVLAAAESAQARGATRFCMGAAWKSPNKRDFPHVLQMVRGVKALGLECCVTLGSLDESQARRLKDAGLDFYNHNLDTSREHYEKIITTRGFQERLDTLRRVRDADIHVCCGGILGLGEGVADRAKLLMELATMRKHPESVPINLLIKVEGTPLRDVADIDPFDFVRCVAVARILMPKSYVRLSAGRENMHDGVQALCFFAGANSVFFGDKLLTAANASADHDMALLARLGLKAKDSESERSDGERSVPQRAGDAVPA